MEEEMRRWKNCKAAPASDTMSSLPDASLSRILSLLPIKDAVATSVLSKSWIHAWHSVDSINFPDIITLNNNESTYSFNQFMYSVLVSRDAAGSHFTNRFCLKIEYDNPNLAYRLGLPNITKWVNLIVQRGLKYLSLHVFVNGHDDDDYDFYDDDYNDVHFPKLPKSILTCRTLVSLDLSGFGVKEFTFPSVGFGFPSLNVLKLKEIRFHEVRDFKLLLAGCPILEYLQAVDVDFHCEEDFLSLPEFKSLSLPKLIHAKITKCWFSWFLVKALTNLEYLCIDTMLFTEEEDDHEVNQPQPQRLYNDIHIFHNMTHLELHYNWNMVAQVLQNCPKLQNLKLYQGSYHTAGSGEDDQEIWVEPEVVPQCLSSYLRTCTILNFSGVQSELMLAKYILKNARNLQFMDIWNQRDQPEIESKLSVCPKASATCQLLFH